jgi:transcriptional regulator with XRE-family HTH domain
MPLNSLKTVISRLRRGRSVRKQFVESNLNKAIAYQIRGTRDRLGWSQEKLAEKVGMNQNAISRLESPDYGKPTLTTLKRLASAFDVAVVVRFVPFSELVDWVTATPRVIKGLAAESLAVLDFDAEEAAGVFARALNVPIEKKPPQSAPNAIFVSATGTDGTAVPATTPGNVIRMSRILNVRQIAASTAYGEGATWTK